MFKPRKHQQELIDELRAWLGGFPLSIISFVAPGGGKSQLPGLAHERFPELPIAWEVPRVSLRSQAAEVLEEMGISACESNNEAPLAKTDGGIIYTRQQFEAQPDLYLSEFARRPYLGVRDEFHHAWRDQKGNLSAAARLYASIRFPVELRMSGSMSRHDGKFIDGLRYTQVAGGWRVEPKQSADIYIRYTRLDGIHEGAIVPIEFFHHDGPVRWRDTGGEKAGILSDLKNKADRAARLFTALHTDLAEILLEEGLLHWKRHGRQLVIVVAHQVDARRYAKLLDGRRLEYVLAISDEVEINPTVRAQIKAFRKGRIPIMITCGMCYEGLDAPGITHVICLTHIRSVPWIEQMLGRAWRAQPGKKFCWAFVPDDPDMNEVIAAIKTEELEEIAVQGDGPGGNGNGTAIVPISSDVERRRIGYLDEDEAAREYEDMIIEGLRVMGLDDDPELFERCMEAKARHDVVVDREPVVLTPTEEMHRLRVGMAKLCNRADDARGVAPGTTQREFYRQTKIIFAKATLEELRDASIRCARFCEKFGVR